MSRLSDRQVLSVTTAAALLGPYSAALSEFEIEMVVTLARRWAEHGRDAEITFYEWPVLNEALDAMNRASAASQTPPNSAPPGASAVPLCRRIERDLLMLNAKAFTALNTTLAALVAAGGVRPEDQANVTQALADLKTTEDTLQAAEAADASAIAALASRVEALEQGINGEAAAVTRITVIAPTVATGQVGVPYTGAFTASGGEEPYNFQEMGGQVAPGLSLSGDGTLSGTPTEAGEFTLEVDAGDVNEVISDPVSFTHTIAAAADAPQPGAGDDKPASEQEPAPAEADPVQTATQAATELA